MTKLRHLFFRRKPVKPSRLGLTVQLTQGTTLPVAYQDGYALAKALNLAEVNFTFNGFSCRVTQYGLGSAFWPGRQGSMGWWHSAHPENVAATDPSYQGLLDSEAGYAAPWRVGQ